MKKQVKSFGEFTRRKVNEDYYYDYKSQDFESGGKFHREEEFEIGDQVYVVGMGDFPGEVVGFDTDENGEELIIVSMLGNEDLYTRDEVSTEPINEDSNNDDSNSNNYSEAYAWLHSIYFINGDEEVTAKENRLTLGREIDYRIGEEVVVTVEKDRPEVGQMAEALHFALMKKFGLMGDELRELCSQFVKDVFGISIRPWFVRAGFGGNYRFNKRHKNPIDDGVYDNPYFSFK